MSHGIAWKGVPGTRFEDGTGKFVRAASGVSGSFGTILEVASGAGFLIGICSPGNPAGPANAYVKITIDGTVQWAGTDIIMQAVAEGNPFALPCIHRFDTSLKIEVKSDTAAAHSVSVAYTLE